MELTDREISKIGVYLTKHFGDEEPTPEQVLSLAKDGDSPIHSYFEWDDKKAAKNFRLIQAAQLIKVVIVDESPKSPPTYQYLKLTADSGTGYFDSDQETESIYDQLIEPGINELRQFKARYHNLEGFRPVIEAIEEVERKYQDVSSKEEIAS